ncbi:MAG: TIGR04282 family arsenosugar biosynthesis glycosyltransferase [Saprospiraceae bacterium]|nr:TIGR04282 family arsenosugar biosynthesis glycosyltransferase [Saprospiraceae bacterium]
MNPLALIIFVKNPELGKVKTRLAETVGDEKALEIYKALLKHTKDVALQLNADRMLYYSEDVPEEEDMWPDDDFQKYIQYGEVLGERMYYAFEDALAVHDKAIIIGSDCASLTPEIVAEAFDALDRFNFVVGPATDGGYYLLGMKKLQIEMFQQMPWSTDQVLPETLARINALGKTVYQLPELSDIDYEEDWKKHGWEI